MPIKYFERKPPRFKHLGRVRLGHKEKHPESGKEYPKADPFFVLTDVPELAEVLKTEQPTTLPIEFLFDDLELTFPHYLRRYGRMGLLCLGDGEHVIYQKEVKGRGKNAQTRDTVRDMHALDENGKPIWDGEHQNIPSRVDCLGEQCPYLQAGECKPTGYLRFLVVGAERQGYYDLVCHQRAVLGILAQLHMAQGFFGRLTGIPWRLHRGEPETVEVPTKQGPRPMKIRTQWIEIEPQWFQKHVGQRREMLLAEKRRQRLLVADTLALWDADDYVPPAETTQEFTRDKWPGERDDYPDWQDVADDDDDVPFTEPPEEGEFEELPDDDTPNTDGMTWLALVNEAIPLGYKGGKDEVFAKIREVMEDPDLPIHDDDDVLTLPYDVFWKILVDHAPNGGAA